MKMVNQKVAVSNGSITRCVRLSDILFFESDREKIIMHYRQIHAESSRRIFGGFREEYWTEETFCFNGTMKDIESRLSKEGFSRVHKCYIVSIPSVSKIEGNTVWLDGVRNPGIPIGRSYSAQFKEAFKTAEFLTL